MKKTRGYVQYYFIVIVNSVTGSVQPSLKLARQFDYSMHFEIELTFQKLIHSSRNLNGNLKINQ